MHGWLVPRSSQTRWRDTIRPCPICLLSPTHAAPWMAAPRAPKAPVAWLTITALALALLAIGVAIGCRSSPHPSKPAAGPTYTGQEIADAKSKVCAFFGKVHQRHSQLTGARDQGAQMLPRLNLPRQ